MRCQSAQESLRFADTLQEQKHIHHPLRCRQVTAPRAAQNHLVFAQGL